MLYPQIMNISKKKKSLTNGMGSDIIVTLFKIKGLLKCSEYE